MPGLSAVQLYLRDVFGGDFTEQDSNPSIATTPTKILSNDPERISVTLVNLGAEDVYITPDNLPSTTRGILLTATGGSVSMDVRTDGTLPTREWWGVSTTNPSTLFVVEMRRYATFPNVGTGLP